MYWIFNSICKLFPCITLLNTVVYCIHTFTQVKRSNLHNWSVTIINNRAFTIDVVREKTHSVSVSTRLILCFYTVYSTSCNMRNTKLFHPPDSKTLKETSTLCFDLTWQQSWWTYSVYSQFIFVWVTKILITPIGHQIWKSDYNST